MLDVLKVILLGIVEGITEWLPVSSTGHLILVGDILKPGLSDAFMEMFNVVIQLGAIMAVVVLYFHKLNPVFTKEDSKTEAFDLADVDQSIDCLCTGRCSGIAFR